MAGSIPGVHNSSTRTELASVISALAKPGGLHIALDNLSVVQGIQSMLEGSSKTKRHWGLRPDGDLWQIAQEAIFARNPLSIAVTWTKGHATWRHIHEGIIT